MRRKKRWIREGMLEYLSCPDWLALINTRARHWLDNEERYFYYAQYWSQSHTNYNLPYGPELVWSYDETFTITTDGKVGAPGYRYTPEKDLYPTRCYRSWQGELVVHYHDGSYRCYPTNLQNT